MAKGDGHRKEKKKPKKVKEPAKQLTLQNQNNMF